MKKIAFITPHYLPSILSGSGIVVMKLAEEFAKQKYDTSIVTSDALTTRYWYDPIFGKELKEKYSILQGIKVYRLSCNQIFSSFCFVISKFMGTILPGKLRDYLAMQSSGPYLRRLKELLEKQQFDVIHISPAPLAINMQLIKACSMLSKKPKIIFTPFFHSHVVTFANPELKKVCEKVDIVHVISQAEKNDILREFSLNKKKIVVIPLFLDVRSMHSLKSLTSDIHQFKEKYNLSNRKIILFAGIKGKAKGAIDVLHATDILYRKDPSYILITIGTDTPEWLAAKKNIDRRCLLDLGYKTGKEKEIVFATCDIFCMPSKSETFGMVYLEAWHKEKPVIAAKTNAVEELIAEKGIFVEFGNIHQIIDAISTLKKKNNTLQELGKKGYNALIKDFTFTAIFPKYKNLFIKL